MGIPIARQIWAGVGLALVGLFMFTNDPASAYQNSLQGDLLCVLAAVFYATYDLRLYDFGKKMGDTPAELIQFKVCVRIVVVPWLSDGRSALMMTLMCRVYGILQVSTQAVLSAGLVAGCAAWQRFQGMPDEVTSFFQR